ncbi:MAG: electron transport complex subunit RsxE [Erysipelotrichaceae bacterium]|nr:electron transport complex subunit RsxE [Erysipelotrichaceae bacterium]
MDRWKNFKSGFLDENPVFGLYLGICSTLAITTTLNSALGMGVSVIAVLIASNVIISALRKIIPDEIRIPVYIVIIASLVTIVEMLIHAYSPSLYSALGSFINLIVVNCIIMGRAEAFASKNSIIDSALDGLGMGLGYTLSLVTMSLIRQIIGTGSIGLSNPFTDDVIFNFQIIPTGYEISLFKGNVGAFLTFAILAASLTAYKNSKKEAKKK